MKIQILSDTHNECAPEPFAPARTDADVVVLAGDIGPVEDSFRWAAGHFRNQRIVMVAGNHDAWDAEWYGLMARMRRQAARYGIDFLENDTVVIAGVKFVGASLFTDMQLFGPGSRAASLVEAKYGMPDYQRIRIAAPNTLRHLLGWPRLMRPEDSVALHAASRDYIEAQLAEKFDGPIVVVTHHAPSTRSIEKRFEHDRLSPCFVSSLDQMIGASQIALWVHGHTHTAFDYRINRTRVVCNAVGYRDRCGDRPPQEITGYRPDLVVEV